MTLIEKLTEYLNDYFKGSCVTVKSNLFSKIGTMIPFVDMKVETVDEETDMVKFDFGSVICVFLFKWGRSVINYGSAKLIEILPKEEILTNGK